MLFTWDSVVKKVSTVLLFYTGNRQERLQLNGEARIDIIVQEMVFNVISDRGVPSKRLEDLMELSIRHNMEPRGHIGFSKRVTSRETRLDLMP